MTDEQLSHALGILAEAESLTGLSFVQLPITVTHDAVAYSASLGEWHVMVVSFEIESQGFPKGSVGYDGIVRKGYDIVRMTRDVAERIFKKASK